MTKKEKDTLVHELKQTLIMYVREGADYNRTALIVTAHLAHALGMTDKELNTTIEEVKHLDAFLVGNKNNIESIYVRNGSIHF